MRALGDGEILTAQIGGAVWQTAWHGPGPAPDGTPHGAGALCVTPQGGVVLIQGVDGRWDAPAGRPEPGETLDETMRREVMEEACAQVTAARLLGFFRAACTQGPERGHVIVRSLWRAQVDVLPWEPQFEIKTRRIVPPSEAWMLLHDANPATARLFRRWFEEAGL